LGLARPGAALHYHLKRHGMTTGLAGLKEVAIAKPGIIDVFHRVGVVIPIEFNQKRFYMDAFTLFSIAFRLFSLADQA